VAFWKWLGRVFALTDTARADDNAGALANDQSAPGYRAYDADTFQQAAQHLVVPHQVIPLGADVHTTEGS
jgi:hypothetical protein